MVWYYKLHGISYYHGYLKIDLDKFRVQQIGSTVWLWRDCDMLEGNLCKGHPDKKPDICRALDINDPTSKTEKMEITKGCALE